MALKQFNIARDLKIAGLEADLRELNDKLSVAARHQTALVQEVDGRFRAHIDKTVADISAAIL